MNRSSKLLPLLIALLAVAIGLQALLFSRSAKAATHHRYLAVGLHGNASTLMQAAIDKYSDDGWEFKSATSSEGEGTTLFFEK